MITPEDFAGFDLQPSDLGGVDLSAETAYTVTDCSECIPRGTALVVLPPVYVCGACGATGDDLGHFSIAHTTPSEEAREKYRELHAQSKTVREFTRYCKETRNRAHR